MACECGVKGGAVMHFVAFSRHNFAIKEIWMFNAAIARRSLLVAAAAIGAVALIQSAPSSAQVAVKKSPFAMADFEAAQKAGQSIIVEVAADWCPTCKVQGPIIQSLTSAAPLDKVRVFTVNFDTQKDALRTLKATSQSTLIGFKGTKETARSIGDTKADSIKALVASTL
jgi:thiol:disulfide interchange protein